MNIASTLKRWRRGRRMSQPEAANALGVTRRTIENWEQGVSKPTGLALEALLAKLSKPTPKA